MSDVLATFYEPENLRGYGVARGWPTLRAGLPARHLTALVLPAGRLGEYAGTTAVFHACRADDCAIDDARSAGLRVVFDVDDCDGFDDAHNRAKWSMMAQLGGAPRDRAYPWRLEADGTRCRRRSADRQRIGNVRRMTHHTVVAIAADEDAWTQHIAWAVKHRDHVRALALKLREEVFRYRPIESEISRWREALRPR